MGNSYLGLRVDALRRAQNTDGGWGYFPGKKSWLEPTVYAALALHGEPAADRAWQLLTSWRQPDGSWRPSAEVHLSHSGTALCVTLATLREEYGVPFHKGTAWLLGTEGMESTLRNRAIVHVASLIGFAPDKRDLRLKGWPWNPDTASWVEPTAHALVALKKAFVKIPSSSIHDRVRLGEALLMDVRCQDGGWNYGNRTARGEELRSYPETTALALLGLQGRSDLGRTIDLASGMLRDTTLPLARAWLAIALRVNGVSPDAPTGDSPPANDVLITGLEALGHPDGNHHLLEAGAVA